MDTAVTRILSKYKKVYFMSYQFIIYFTVTINDHQVLLKLMYKSIHQSSYKYKLLKFTLDCDFDKELPPILNNLYQKHIEQEMIENKNTPKGILKKRQLPKKCVTFDLPPIPEDTVETSKWVSPLIKFTHPTCHSHLMDPRCPDK